MKIEDIELSSIKEGAANARKEFVAIDELAESIKSHGLIHPLRVRAHDDGYEVISGARRLRALRKLKRKTAPCEVIEASDIDARLSMFAENANREDVSPLDEARAFVEFAELAGKKWVPQLMAATGKPKAYIYARAKMASASPEVLDLLTSGKISPVTCERAARESAEVQADFARRARATETVTVRDGDVLLEMSRNELAYAAGESTAEESAAEESAEESAAEESAAEESAAEEARALRSAEESALVREKHRARELMRATKYARKAIEFAARKKITKLTLAVRLAVGAEKGARESALLQSVIDLALASNFAAVASELGFNEGKHAKLFVKHKPGSCFVCGAKSDKTLCEDHA